MNYKTMKLTELRELAKERKLHAVSALRKDELIRVLEKTDSTSSRPVQRRTSYESARGRSPRPERNSNAQYTASENGVKEMQGNPRPVSGKEWKKSPAPRRSHRTVLKQPVQSPERQDMRAEGTGHIEGYLEVMAEGFGFIRSNGYAPGENDTYVAPAVIRRFRLKTADYIVGLRREKSPTEKTAVLQTLFSANGMKSNEMYSRPVFEKFTPIFPAERFHLETASLSVSMRIMNLITPVGKGQRGLIVAPPKAGKTTLLKEIARSITHNHPDVYLLILLIDERPEEVTDIRESIVGERVEVMASTFDELPEHHKHIAEIAAERAKRLVEQKKDVVILLDSITRLTRAYNVTGIPSGRTLSGGLDPAALHMPKRFFGAARNTREAGSLTILATALIETGSKLDDVVYEEFKGTGNMELTLSRRLQERRIFPAIDISKSGTRRDDLLLSEDERLLAEKIRRSFASEKDMEQLIACCEKAKTTEELKKMISE